MKTLPLVSVLIPCYNVEKHIINAILSLNNQTYKNIEIICVDDGSTDNTNKIIKEIQLEYSFVTLISQQNKGILEARRTALNHAQGDFIVLLDADDKLESNAIYNSIQCLHEHKCNAALFEVYKVTENETHPFIIYTEHKIITGLEALKSSIGYWKISSLGVFKKSVYEKAFITFDNIKVESYNSDELLGRIALFESDKIILTDSKYYYTTNLSSNTLSFKMAWLEVFKTNKTIKEYLINNQIYAQIRSEFFNHYSIDFVRMQKHFRKNKKSLPKKDLIKYRNICLKSIRTLSFKEWLESIFNKNIPIKRKLKFLKSYLSLKLTLL
ncbi:glycosyl transferase family A [Shewanella sp. NFH-SH190041]|uniref:glycosyltransferase family 2 protein n=1 Tax=Shewanella sp. NFH-SH190041 TaxID=2950245 RepID=UPI0021C29054|nr:glycosyltransferase family 2 protein [Shewanella sp. NFH-SH190041]BDM62765.1 glycosyl transferase family A [Shewanella sp. NFH-SH190041]